MGTRRIDSLEDFARHHMNVHVECRCGHKGVVDAQRALWVFMVYRWPRSKTVMGRHFVCSACRQRSPRSFGPTEAKPTFPNWGPKDAREAQKLARKVRG